MSEPRPLHRLFSLSWTDFFRGTDVSVEPEVDLSLKRQLIDLVLTRTGSGPLPLPLPDGFDNLGQHNLVTFKSHQEALDSWALLELIGHYVNFRKQRSESNDDLLSPDVFRLYAVCVRFPQSLASLGVLRPLRAGVYEVVVLDLTIRVIVVHQLPLEQQNAMLHLFSVQENQVRYGQTHYRPHSNETSTLLLKLLLEYTRDPDMPLSVDDFVRQTIEEVVAAAPPEQLLRHLTPEQRLQGLPPEQRLEGLPPEQLLNQLTPEQRLEGLAPEQRLEGLAPEQRLEGLAPEQRLEGLAPEQMRILLEAIQRRLQSNGPSSPPT